MIEFDCPECGASNEASDRKAGRRVRCRKCDERIDVPDNRPKKRRRDPPPEPRLRDELNLQEYLIYGVLFLVSPGINVIVSTFLFYNWKDTLPTKAYQVNQLAWVIFGIQTLPWCLCCCISVVFSPARPQRRF